MEAQLKPSTNKSFILWIAALSVFLLIGLGAGIYVLFNGLSETNLSDLVPWGLWITIDLSSIALSAGAFLFCAAVYLLNLKEFQPMAKTAAFIGLIGYAMAMMCLLMDIGRPDRFWHGFVFWNTHSVLWEVTMCVGLYFTVLFFENLPTLAQFEWLRKRFPKLAKRMEGVHHYAPYLAVAGLFLSMLHQSSLGATYGVLISRPIWYRPGLAALFIISAGAGGIALTTFVTWLVGMIRPETQINDNLLEKASKFLGWWLVAYLYLRFWDAFAMTYTHQPGKQEGLGILTSGPLSFNFWMGEILLGIIVPIVILLSSRLRENKLLRGAALLMIVSGVVAYRWDTNLVGQLIVQPPSPVIDVPLFAHYFPSTLEFMVAAGIIAFGLFAFTLGVRYLNIIDHSTPEHAAAD
jgi:Ni/Fe-hydrogenase subunit HybB-like protein